MILDEHLDRTITETESRDVIFLEGEFPRKGDIDEIARYFEVDESRKGVLNPDKENESDLLPSGCVPSSGSVPLGSDSEATYLRRSQCGNPLSSL